MITEQKQINQFNCRVISGNGEGPAMVFLHGYMFTGEVWNQIGLLPALEKKKIPFAAVDMPYGHHAECDPGSSDSQDTVILVGEIAGKTDILIGASMGGNVALTYAVDHPVGGLVLIAPVGGLAENLVNKYEKFTVPVLIVYGENDAIVGRHEMETLAGRLNASLQVYENAGHPAYLDQPEKFINDVISFYNDVKT